MAQVVLWEEAPLRVTAAGRWLHGQVPLHPRVQRLFARHVVPAAGGGWQVVLGQDRQPLQVEDTPLHVISAHVQPASGGGGDAAVLRLSDGQSTALRPACLSLSGADVLYTWVPRDGHQLPARFVPSAYYALMLPLLCEAQPDAILWRGRPLPIPRWAAGRPPPPPSGP